MQLHELETVTVGTRVSLPDVLDGLRYNDQGLVAAIAQEATTNKVLMLAWMNREAIELTLTSGQVTYFSRSRNELWRKGETSGHTQHLVSMRFDCDGDAILMSVDQAGPACHTNRPHCFYKTVGKDSVEITSEPVRE